MNVRRHTRITGGPDQDGIEVPPQYGEAVGWNSHAISKIAFSAPVELCHLHSSATCLNNFDGLGNDFLPHPISRNDRDRLYRLQLQAIIPTLWGQREPAIIAAPL